MGTEAGINQRTNIMKVVLTGATGFIGRYVLKELAKLPIAITVIGRTNKMEAPNPSQAQYIQFDLCDSTEGTFKRLGEPDLLFHLAWGGLNNFSSPKHLEHELPMHYRFLEQMIIAGLPSLLITGTCLEYGLQSGALSEQSTTAPVTPYGTAKDTLRRQLDRLNTTRPFKLTWARLFYLFGKGQAEKTLYSQLLHAAERGDSHFNMSGGKQLRDYLPVEDVANLLVRLGMKQQDLGVVNLCSGTPTSVLELVNGWREQYNLKIQLNPGHYPYPNYEPMEFWGDNKKLLTSLASCQ